MKNRGDVASPPFGVTWQVDGIAQTPLLPHSSVGAQSSLRDAKASFTWRALPGSHVIAAWVDPPPGAVEEASENNNVHKLRIKVPAAPDLQPTEIVFDPSAIGAGEPVLFDSGVKNLGSAVAGDFNVRWRVDGNVVAEGLHAGVPAGAKVLDGKSQMLWTPSPGKHEVAFEVDYDDQLAEGDEKNNHIVATVLPASSRIVRVDTDPVAISGDKNVDKLFDGVTWWPNTAIVHFVQHTPVGVRIEFAQKETLEAFRVSVAGTGGSRNLGTYRFKVETANEWGGPFTTALQAYEIDCRIEVATVRLPAPTTAKVFRVTATRANGDGIVHWLELEPIARLNDAGFPYGFSRVDTDPVTYGGWKVLNELVDGVVRPPQRAISYYEGYKGMATLLQFEAPPLVAGFWVSVTLSDAALDSLGGIYRWKVERGDSWNGPFTTLLSDRETVARDGLVALMLPAPVTSKVFKVTTSRASGNGYIYWLDTGWSSRQFWCGRRRAAAQEAAPWIAAALGMPHSRLSKAFDLARRSSRAG